MTFYADLHVHSRFSRATSRDCNLEQLAYWARRKGLAVVGTGDFTHPGWRGEIREQLVPAEPGLFRLRSDLEQILERRLPPSLLAGTPGASAPGASPARFMLEVEISTIYKKKDRTRKVHHVVFVPDLDSAERFVARLERIGNLGSDGRPILGLDSRDLLEITLESGAGCSLVPAHIWTPWFSALGSKSGFDAISECYGDLAGHIFAVETGLSSDPSMNWRVSGLDAYRLVSNSDAHSPAKLAREACVFDTDVNYFAMRRALETGEGYGGTVEFFPEEGKYHLDGHRKCGVRLSPEETRKNKGRCPVCGKPLTVGVMYRVVELADRPAGARPQGAAPFRSLVPLPEILAEILGVGAGTRTVARAYEAMIRKLGSELFILDRAPIGEIARAASPRVAEAVARMREGRVRREAGYDGEYGTIRLFEPGELKSDAATGLLLDVPAEAPARPTRRPRTSAEVATGAGAPSRRKPRPAATPPGMLRETRAVHLAPTLFGILGDLDPEQRAAAGITRGALLITAGPGTGKTRTLTHRIAHLVADHDAPPEQCLAVTFTRRAAAEMRERLLTLLPERGSRVPVLTFHALGYTLLREHADRAGLPAGFRVAAEAERSRLRAEDPDGYATAMRTRGWVDFDDLIALTVRLLESHADVLAACRDRYRWISVDEYQDVDEQQYRLVRLLAPPGGNLCVIGDPDQAIYGFRGSDVRFFRRFVEDYPDAKTVQLTRNYRSNRTIVDASLRVITPATLVEGRSLEALFDDPERVTLHEAATDRAEAEFVVHTVEQLIGGSTFFSMDSGRVADEQPETYSFADFAVLYRTEAQADALCEAFHRSGMPYQRRSHAPLGEEPLVQRIVSAMQELPGEAPPIDRLARAVERFREDENSRDAERFARALRPLAERAGAMPEFLSELALGTDADLWDPRADAVSLLTIHAAKGLEFAAVFLVGCEDGILPLRWGRGRDTGNTDEERRLFFVAMTRAGRRLFLCHARKRAWRGKIRERTPSPFLRDIEEALLARSRTRLPRRRRPAHRQLDLF